MSDYSVLMGMVSALLGDIEDDQYTTEQIDAALRIALGRYSLVKPNVETQVLQLASSGLLSQSLASWSTTTLLEILLIAWPGTSSSPSTFTENLVTDWYLYFSGENTVPIVDLQVDGGTLPVTDDYILVQAMVGHTLEGMDMYQFNGGSNATKTTIPSHHWHILALGAAGYAARAHEQQLSMQAGAAATGYTDTYVIGTLAEQAVNFLAEFESELRQLEKFSRTRFPWSNYERKRLERT